MVKKRIIAEEEISKVLEIINDSLVDLSIRQVKKILEERYGIIRSPQVVKRYLLYLKNKGEIR